MPFFLFPPVVKSFLSSSFYPSIFADEVGSFPRAKAPPTSKSTRVDFGSLSNCPTTLLLFLREWRGESEEEELETIG